MKESDFINKNKKFWKSSEHSLKTKKSVTGLGDSFVKITDDLSYSQTYYNRRSVRIYLNQLSQNFYNRIHSTGRDKKIDLFRFWRDELPLIIYQSRKYLLASTIIFSIAVIIGIFSTEMNPEFVRDILGDGYVNMTEENIAQSDPMAVYKSQNFLEMFFRIWINNLFVSVWIYTLGILFCIGTVGILVSNGVMLGTFQYFFYQKGLLYESFLTIWQHGTIEILSILIEGTAGLVLGASLIFPGTLPRSVSLKIGAIKSLKIFLGCVPLITLAAFIEAFFTRYTNMPDAIRWLVILGSFALMFGYYVVLPIIKGRKFKAEDYDIDFTQTTKEIPISWGTIKKNAEVFFDTLLLLKTKFTKTLGVSVALAILFSIYIVVVSREVYYLDLSMNLRNDEFFIFGFFTTLYKVVFHLYSYGSFFHFYNDIALWVVMSIAMSIIATLSLNVYFHSKLGIEKTDWLKTMKNGAFYFIALLIIFSVFFVEESWINIGWRMVVVLILLPIVYWIPMLKYLYNLKSGNAFFLSVDLFFRFVPKLLGFLLILFLLAFLIQIFFDSPVLYATIYMANMFIGISETTGLQFLSVMVLSFSLTGLFLIFNTYFNGLAVFADSMHEINTADSLIKRIKSITPKKKIYGVTSE